MLIEAVCDRWSRATVPGRTGKVVSAELRIPQPDKQRITDPALLVAVGCQRRDRNPGARGTGPGSYAATGCGAASLRNAAARPKVSPMV